MINQCVNRVIMKSSYLPVVDDESVAHEQIAILLLWEICSLAMTFMHIACYLCQFSRIITKPF